MTISRTGRMLFFVLCLTLTSVSAIRKLRTVNDLKTINVGVSVPAHSLVLLYWFANTIEIDNNDIIQLTFEPENGDYGAHHYGNYEELLPALPRGRFKYYTLGNLNQRNIQDGASALPSYVTRRNNNLIQHEERNRDRIVFRVRQTNTRDTIDLAYITQHYGMSHDQGTVYDPQHTYQITTNLLREIRQFSEDDHSWGTLLELRKHFGSNLNDMQLINLSQMWGNLACLGLLLFIVTKERHPPTDNNQRAAARPNIPKPTYDQYYTQPHCVVNIPDSTTNHVLLLDERQSGDMKLEVKTSTNGKAKIQWHNIPQNILDKGVMVVLFKNTDTENSGIRHFIDNRSSGSYDTTVPLNPGLQVRLHKVKRWCLFWNTMGDEIYRGEEFHNNESEMTVSIRGYDANLQLFVKDGKACARLYVSKAFTNWRSEFNKSWVGFYSSERKSNNEYETWQWQWATKFTRCTQTDGTFDIYEYHSSMAIAPRVQARFIFNKYMDIACTDTWEW